MARFVRHAKNILCTSRRGMWSRPIPVENKSCERASDGARLRIADLLAPRDVAEPDWATIFNGASTRIHWFSVRRCSASMAFLNHTEAPEEEEEEAPTERATMAMATVIASIEISW